MRISAALPAGVTALLFDEARKRRRFEDSAVEAFEAEGFSEVVLPILDYLRPYESLLTPELREELYRFVDRDGELLALRGDFTPMLARLLAPRLGALKTPLRLFYRGDVVRYQEERPGRLREYYVVGAEHLGARGDAADEEMIDLFLRQLTLDGRRGIRVILGFAGALDGLLTEVASGDRMGLVRAVSRRERRLVGAASPFLLEVVEDGVPEDPEALGASAARGLRRLQALEQRLQSRFDPDVVTLTIDLAEFVEDFVDPGLEQEGARRPYYDGLMFRAYFDVGAQSIGRGGRYDRLFRRLGADLGAVGFSISVDPLLRGDRL